VKKLFVVVFFWACPVWAQLLCDDRSVHSMTRMPKPANKQTYVDPQFGTTIRRITAAPLQWKENAVIIPMYSTVPAWNADESKLLLYTRGLGGTHLLYDGRTYKFIKEIHVAASDIEHLLWDPQDPDIFYYPSNYPSNPDSPPVLNRYHVSTDKIEAVHNFSDIGCNQGKGRPISLGHAAYMSWAPGSKLVGLQCGEIKFLYDIVTDKVTGFIRHPQPKGSQANTVAPGPSGNFGEFLGRVADRSFQKDVVKLPLASVVEHNCLGISKSGHDTYNAVVFDPPPPGGGALVSFDMVTGAAKVIIGPATGYPPPMHMTHISAIAIHKPGLVGVSIVGKGNGQGVLDSEILLADVDTGKVCRVGHHRSLSDEGPWGYWGEPHVTLSPSGTRALFASDWGGGPSVDTYVVELSPDALGQLESPKR
jgi:hypothetical protein